MVELVVFFFFARLFDFELLLSLPEVLQLHLVVEFVGVACLFVLSVTLLFAHSFLFFLLLIRSQKVALAQLLVFVFTVAPTMHLLLLQL